MAALLTVRKYIQALDPIARTRYEEKLQLVGLNESEDPYMLEDDMKSGYRSSMDTFSAILLSVFT